MDVEVEIKQAAPVKNKPGKPSFAAFIDNPTWNTQLFGDSVLQTFYSSSEPDKMGNLRKLDYHDRLKVMRFYYEFDPIAGTVIDKIVDIGITGMYLDRGDCSDGDYEIYESCLNIFNKYLKEAALEYLLSGLVVPQTLWIRKTPTEMAMPMRRRSVEVPTRIWILNPSDIELVNESFTDDVVAYFKISDALKKLIKEQSKQGEELRKNYPELVRQVQEGINKVKIINTLIIRRKAKTYDPYPTPYLQAAVESLEFKRNLRKMDYAIAARVISAIQLIRLGNDQYPLTEDDEDQLEKLKLEILWRNSPNQIERVFQLFGNHTLQIEWIYPDTESMLNQDKYQAVNEDIFNALGMPRILVSGETTRSATSQAEFAMFSPAESIKRVREEVLTYVDFLVKEIQKRNNLKNRVTPKFQELRLYDITKISTVAANLYKSNALSLTSLANSAGYNFEDEIVMKARERDLMAEHDIPETVPMPFSAPPKTPNGGNSPEDQPEGNPKENPPTG